jgi:hypothetical protein
MIRDKVTIAPITSQTEIQSVNEAIKNVFGATAAEKDAAPRTFRKSRSLPGFHFLGRLHSVKMSLVVEANEVYNVI